MWPFKRQFAAHWRGRSVRARVRQLEEGAEHHAIVNTSQDGFRFSTRHSVQGFGFPFGTAGNDQLVKIRFTNIAQGDGDEQRSGHTIRMSRILGEIMLIWTGLNPAVGESDTWGPRKSVDVRMMLLQTLDETSEDPNYQTPPTLNDILADSDGGFGTFPLDSAQSQYHCMHGGYKVKTDKFMSDTAAIDRTQMRQRKFRVYWDKMVTLHHDVNDQLAFDAVSFTVPLNGLRRTTTDAASGGADVVESRSAKKMIIKLNVPMNCDCTYLQEDPALPPANECRGNVWLYMWSSAWQAGETALTAAQWPTNNGTATLAQTRVAQVVMRYRFKHYWIDV